MHVTRAGTSAAQRTYRLRRAGAGLAPPWSHPFPLLLKEPPRPPPAPALCSAPAWRCGEGGRARSAAMAMALQAETEAARGVLGSFLRDFPAPLGPEEPPPWSPQGSGALSRAEARGELAELARALLVARNAPPLLTAALIHAATDEVLQTDLSTFEKSSVEEEQGDQQRLTLLDGVSLQRYFFNKLRDICCEWQKQLPLLRPLKRFLLVSIHAIRNTRRKMEDRHVSLLEFNQLFGMTDDIDRAYFAVFDGHGGVDAANYAATHLHVNIALHDEFLKNPSEALKYSFQQTDEMFLLKAKRERLRNGTTGVCALIVGNRLHIAWLGDSQVMLVRQGKAVTLMEPHKPEREDERTRIEALGGYVTYLDCWRVNGTLAVSRAIGDIYQKPYVSGSADVDSFELTGSEDYLVLACDGFFDTVKPCDVVDLVLDHLMKNKGDGLKTAQRLVAAAKENGSSDNITVLVVFLRDPQDILADFLRDPKSLVTGEGAQDSPFNFFSSETNNQSDSQTTRSA